MQVLLVTSDGSKAAAIHMALPPARYELIVASTKGQCMSSIGAKYMPDILLLDSRWRAAQARDAGLRMCLFGKVLAWADGVRIRGMALLGHCYMPSCRRAAVASESVLFCSSPASACGLHNGLIAPQKMPLGYGPRLPKDGHLPVAKQDIF
eukprot:scaffold51445_cov17-Tisochrysis_lutea.AAC.2